MSYIINAVYYSLIYITSDYLFIVVKKVNFKKVAYYIKQIYSHNNQDLTSKLNII